MRARIHNKWAADLSEGMQQMKEDMLHTLGYAIGATLAAGLLGLLVVWILVTVQQPQATGCEVKPANYRGVKK